MRIAVLPTPGTPADDAAFTSLDNYQVSLRRQGHDSGYPCRIDRSSGRTEYAFSRTTAITVPRARALMIGLLIVGVVGVAITRRRRR